MADPIEQAEKAKYAKMWEFDSYRERSPGLRHLQLGLSLLKPQAGQSIVDLGCGSGRVAAALSELGLKVSAVDIAANACAEFTGPFFEACLWSLPNALGVHDYGYCADVMEHIPTDRVDECLHNIARHCKTTYFQIANFECHEGDKIGESLHLTVQNISWWHHKLKQYFLVEHMKAYPKNHVFLCKSLAY